MKKETGGGGGWAGKGGVIWGIGVRREVGEGGRNERVGGDWGGGERGGGHPPTGRGSYLKFSRLGKLIKESRKDP